MHTQLTSASKLRLLNLEKKPIMLRCRSHSENDRHRYYQRAIIIRNIREFDDEGRKRTSRLNFGRKTIPDKLCGVGDLLPDAEIPDSTVN